jgi:hypothetical protein
VPLTAKGEKIMRAMKQQYGEKEGERNFYKSKNAGTITGVDRAKDAAKIGRDSHAGTFVAGGQRR